MNKYRLLGVYREKRFSPGMVEKDAAVLRGVLIRLAHEKYPFRIESVSGEDISKVDSRPDFVLTMAQSEESLNKLAVWMPESEVINSVDGVRNCYREKMVNILTGISVGFPETLLLAIEDLEKVGSFPYPFPVWLKRSDVHAMYEGDVVFIQGTEALKAALVHYRERNILTLAIQRHISGRVCKFYGVGRGDFFKAYEGRSGREVTGDHVPELMRLASKAAEALGLEVYGGDAVVDERGEIHIIDMNDWPSFSACCDEAAEAISRYVIRKWKIN